MVNLLTQEEVRLLCKDVGFNDMNARIASAIAMCEGAFSEGGKQYSNFDAVGDLDLVNNKWGPSYGGFQIRSLKSETGTGSFRDATKLLIPRFNCRAAKHIKANQGWKAWSVYTSGMYKAYLQDLFPPPPNTYVVLSGDTLTGIGAKLNIDWQDLARWNNLHSPYTIFIGQILLKADPVGA